MFTRELCGLVDLIVVALSFDDCCVIVVVGWILSCL